VLTQPSVRFAVESARDVVVLAWPEQAADRERLERRNIPRLWLVEPGAEPPVAETCLEDWLRLPADDADVRARLVSLARRAEHHPPRPTLDEHGELGYRDLIAYLSPAEQLLARVLVDRFGSAVPESELLAATGDRDGNEQTLRVHVSRLRRRVAPMGLTVVSIRSYGYAMRADA